MDIIKSIEFDQMKAQVPDLKVGNTVRVHIRITEGNKSRLQVFEGTIIKIQGGGVNKTFTVRRISYGVGVEKTFLVHSPVIEKVEVSRIGRARRAKLYYLRDKLGKQARTREKIGAKIEMDEIVIKDIEVPETEAEVITEEDILKAEDEIEEDSEETTEDVVEEVKEESKEEAEEAEVETTVNEEAVEEIEETANTEEVVEDKKEEENGEQ